MRPSTCRVSGFVSVIAAAGAAASLLGCATRPDFDAEKAHGQIAAAFARDIDAVQLMDDGRGKKDEPDTWIVDFKLDGFDPYLQAKFVGRREKWELDVVRERPSGPQETRWTEIGSMLGRFRAEAVERARGTEKVLSDAAALIERYGVEHGNRYPTTNLEGIRKLVIGAGYLEEGAWRHGSDPWGNSLAYHAAPDGQSYILLSPGADGRWDEPLETYFSNTDQGMEIYGGASEDTNKDFIWASGSFVQSYGP